MSQVFTAEGFDSAARNDKCDIVEVRREKIKTLRALRVLREINSLV